jgi:hypothetical protein
LIYFKSDLYRDDQNRCIEHRIYPEGKPEGAFEFHAETTIELTLSSKEKRPCPVRFPLKAAKTIREAFEAFDAARDAAQADTQAEFDQQVAARGLAQPKRIFTGA